jgi:peptidoglycan/xylan/chitin deacetylase (PgdA/CDA1 family)
MTSRCKRTILSGWPTTKKVYLTLDFESDYGTALRTDSYDAVARSDLLARFVERNSLPLSCFLQTEVLEEAPHSVTELASVDSPIEFHAHTHTHPLRDEADVDFEVRKSVDVVRERFGVETVGFRFPDGAANKADYWVLKRNEVSFAASLFPSWRPNRFDNHDQPIYPFRHDPTGIVELPFTVYSRTVRIPVSLSYLKLLGRPFEWLVRYRPLDVIVFDMHMHDIVVPPAFEDLPSAYRAVYARNKYKGLQVLDRVVTALREHGYTFGLMSNLHERVEEEFSQYGRHRTH